MGRQCVSRPTITPFHSCYASLYRHIKRGWGTHFGEHTALQGEPDPSQIAPKLYGTKGGLLDPKRVPKPVPEQNYAHSYRQHQSGCLYKQGRRHEIGPSVCPSGENHDLVFQEKGDFQSQTHSRLAECYSRQSILVRPDHPNRMVPPFRGLQVDLLLVAPASSGSVCHQVQQQGASICITSSRPPSTDNECTQFAFK